MIEVTFSHCYNLKKKKNYFMGCIFLPITSNYSSKALITYLRAVKRKTNYFTINSTSVYLFLYPE